ncbi:hypothetical protein HBE96_08880 [Clostridium sp. P21]|uniref:Uroporphyrinogen decarboxylase (URO-D) domain-containing protein n=1 Tax=Clostridium muellerianum TaxID=2716538 RepID=A0A7Y0EG37_9CLOT|nr:uroporphyrinogen decarboxylase family protein [Clostridium muellerianum]NMM62810.1 hypothetical protein [Clostridium muellerianum]
MLTPKDRLFLVFKGKSVGRPLCICPGGMMNMIIEEVMDLTGCKWPEAHMNPEIIANLAVGVYENGGFENVGVPFCMTVEAEAMRANVFLGTKITEPRVTDYIIDSVDKWRNLKNININGGRAKVVLDAIKILEEYIRKISGNCVKSGVSILSTA